MRTIYRAVWVSAAASMTGSEECTHLVPVFHPGRFRKEGAGERTPLLEAFGFAEVDHVMIHALPIDAEPVTGRILFDLLQAHAVAAFGRTEMRCRLGNRGFEGIRFRGIDGDIRNFSNHAGGMDRRRERGKS